MFEVFQRSFSRDPGRVAETGRALPKSDVPGFSELIAMFGGSSFGCGLYRVIRAADLDQWKAHVRWGFQNLKGGSPASATIGWVGPLPLTHKGRSRGNLVSSCSNQEQARP